MKLGGVRTEVNCGNGAWRTKLFGSYHRLSWKKENRKVFEYLPRAFVKLAISVVVATLAMLSIINPLALVSLLVFHDHYAFAMALTILHIAVIFCSVGVSDGGLYAPLCLVIPRVAKTLGCSRK